MMGWQICQTGGDVSPVTPGRGDGRGGLRGHAGPCVAVRSAAPRPGVPAALLPLLQRMWKSAYRSVMLIQ